MKTEKLFELLTLVDGVNTGRWNAVMQVVDLIAKGSVDIKAKKWNDSFKEAKPEYYPLDLADLKTWSTFEDSCVELKFFNDTTTNRIVNQLVCDVKIYDGESFGGRRQQLRFTATLWMPTAFLHNIEDMINWAFESYLEDAYESHLEAQKKLWINNMKSEILNH